MIIAAKRIELSSNRHILVSPVGAALPEGTLDKMLIQDELDGLRGAPLLDLYFSEPALAPLFVLKWDPHEWLAKMDEQRDNKSDRARLLRILVMLPSITYLRRHCNTLSSMSNTQFKGPPAVPDLNSIKPYPFRGNVLVERRDCLHVAKDMTEATNSRVLVLNMAHPQQGGGDYRKGAGAQEEDLMRRTSLPLALCSFFRDKFGSVPVGLPTTPTYPICGHDPTHPIGNEFGAVLTKNVTVFRGTSNEGYPFIDPFEIDVVSVAAYRIKERKDAMEQETLLKMHRKLQAILAVAASQGYHSIVLSSIGCGAYNNPPHIIAELMKSVLFEFRGYFSSVSIAIYDTSKEQRNFNAFRNALSDHFLRFDVPTVNLGEYAFSSENVMLCRGGALCPQQEDKDHVSKFHHPPMCLLADTCDAADKSPHSLLWRHPQPCPAAGKCTKFQDEPHCMIFSHPPECMHGPHCADNSDGHLVEYLHVPVCPKGYRCETRNRGCHKRHFQQPCKFGSFCNRHLDEEHHEHESHPFVPPCKQFRSCIDGEPRHKLDRSHACHFGTKVRNSPLFLVSVSLMRAVQQTRRSAAHEAVFPHRASRLRQRRLQRHDRLPSGPLLARRPSKHTTAVPARRAMPQHS